MPLPLETERLILRAPVLADVEPLYAGFWSDPRAMRYIGKGDVPPRDGVERAMERWLASFEETGLALYTVVERATGEVIGDCGVIPMERKGPEIEIGYRFRRSAWGRGIATEAAAAAKAYAMAARSDGGLGIERLIAVTNPANIASRRVLEKIGLVYVGETDRYYDSITCLYETAAVVAPPPGEGAG